MRWLRFGVLVLVAAVAQTGFAGLVSLVHRDIRPDLLAILLVFFATHYGGRDVVIASFSIGFAADLANVAAGFMGPRTISFGLLGTMLSDLNSLLSIRKMAHQGAAIFVMCATTSVLSSMLAHLKVGQAAQSLGRGWFWQPAVSAIIGPFLFWPVAWWMGRTRSRLHRNAPNRGISRHVR